MTLFHFTNAWEPDGLADLNAASALLRKMEVAR